MAESKLLANAYPIRMAVVLALSLVFVVLMGAAAIGGAYLIAGHAIDVNNMTQHALAAREATSQLRSSIPLCHALSKLGNDAQDILNEPAVKNAPNSAQPVIRFLQDFPDVFKTSSCARVLQFAATHK